MKFRRIDLNLLHIFDAVMRYHSLSRAAKALDLTPSAVSHALSRLRHIVRDDLFLRDGMDMKPTPRALELAVLVGGSLATLENALTQEPFVAAESRRCFRIAAGDYGGLLILPRLVAHLAQEAPHIDLHIVPTNRTDIGRQLERGGVDLVLGWFDRLPPNTCRQLLFTDSDVLIVRHGHPLTHETVTLERIFDFPHLVVDLTVTPEAREDGFLEEGGLARRVWMERTVLEAQNRRDLSARVAVKVPSFAVVAPIIKRSDLVATLPERLARREVAKGGIVMLERLEQSPAVNIEVIWHPRSEPDEGLRWLLDALASICADIAAGSRSSECNEYNATIDEYN